MQSEKSADRLLQFASGTEATPADLLFRDGRKPAFHQVQPACRGGSEVHVEARTFEQPSLDGGGLVRGVVVQDQVHVQCGGHMAFNDVQELAREASGAR